MCFHGLQTVPILTSSKMFGYSSKKKLNNDHRGPPTTREELVVRIFEEWRRIPQSYIAKLYDSIPRRQNEVQKMRGYPTKY